MDLQHLIALAINVSIALTVFSLGLQATIQDATYLLRHPGRLLRSLAAMNVVMLIVAILIALVFNPAPVIKIALIALALSPVPPILPAKQLKSGGSSAYTIGLLSAASIAAIVVVPVGLSIVENIFGLELYVAPRDVAGVVMMSIVLPLLAGLIVRRFAPAFAESAARPISIISMIMLVIALIPILFVTFPRALALTGNGLILALLLFASIGVAVGHWLGGPDADDRTVLALATSARHPGVAMAIASLNFPDVAQSAAVVVLYHLILGMIVAVPYVRWRTREHAAARKRAA